MSFLKKLFNHTHTYKEDINYDKQRQSIGTH